MDFVQPSRELLAETLIAAGPQDPTLCEGWDTRHLAAHLYVREHQPLDALGMLGGPLAARTDKAINSLADAAVTVAEFNNLVAKFRRGPGRLSPMRIKRVDRAANTIEYFVHTEDVRRAQERWVPRALDEEYTEVLWSELIKRAGMLYRGVDLGIILVRPDGPRHVVKKAESAVAITGEPAELLMHAHGRQKHALVTLEGDEDAVALLTSAQIGL